MVFSQGAPLKLRLGGLVAQLDCHPEQALTATMPKTEFWRIRVHSSHLFTRAAPYNHLRRWCLEGVSSGYWTPPAKRSSGFQPLGFESLALRALDQVNFLAIKISQSYS